MQKRIKLLLSAIVGISIISLIYLLAINKPFSNEDIKPLIIGGHIRESEDSQNSTKSSISIYYPSNNYSEYITITSASAILLEESPNEPPKKEEIEPINDGSQSTCINSKVYGSGNYSSLDAKEKAIFLKKMPLEKMFIFIENNRARCFFNISLTELSSETEIKEGLSRKLIYEIKYLTPDKKEQTVNKEIPLSPEY